MSVTVEKLEGNMAKLTFECEASEFEKAVEKAYQKNKGRISIPGFRKGKAPLAMIKKIYGVGVFYEDALNDLVPRVYDEYMATEEGKALDVVSQPEIDFPEEVLEGKKLVFTATVAVRPEVELGQYKGFTDIEKKPVEVTEEDLAAELERVRNQNSRTVTVEDRALEMGDTANIDYEGFMDGVPFDGGKAEKQDLVLGSHTFIDTFEDQLVGKNIGDECEVNVTFPEEYHAPDLAGKPAVFKVKINGIKVKELPELNDEFAEEVSDFDTLEEYKEDLKKKLEAQKQTTADTEYQNEILKKAVENAKMIIPDAMIDSEAAQMVNEYTQRLQMQGLSIEQYMQITGQTKDQLKEQMKPQAESRIKNSLVLEEIAKAEKVEITEEEISEEIKKMAESYGMTEEQIAGYITDNEKASIRRDLEVRKALEIISA